MINQTQLTSLAKRTYQSKQIQKQEWTHKCKQVQLTIKAW